MHCTLCATRKIVFFKIPCKILQNMLLTIYQRYPASSHRVRSTSPKFSQLGIAFAIAMHTMAATTNNCKMTVWKFLSVKKIFGKFLLPQKVFSKKLNKIEMKISNYFKHFMQVYLLRRPESKMFPRNEFI